MNATRRAPRASSWLLFAASLLPWGSAVRAAPDTCSASYITNEVRDESPIAVHGERLQSVNVFAFQFDGACRMVPQSPWVAETALRLKDDPRRLVLVDIVNEILSKPGPCNALTPGQLIHRLLSDPARRAAHVREVVAVGALGQGVEIDYENLLPETKPHLTTFMRELRAALPPEKRLGIVVQPKTRAGGGAGRNLDWRGIAPSVDYFRVMAYYYAWKNSAPGPVITYAKLAELADYMVNDPDQSLPREKARIVLSLYGWDWPVSPAGPGRLVRYEEAAALARAHGVTPQRHPVEDTLHFQYRDAAGVLHEVWYEDFVGHSKRIQLLLDRDFPAVDLWHLGTGDPALWPWFAERISAACPSLAAPAAVASAAALERLDIQAVPAGRGGASVALEGAGFSASDVVLWNGAPYIPSFASDRRLQVALAAEDLAEPYEGRIAVAQGGRLGGLLPLFVVGNPVLDALEPPYVPGGPGGFTLTVRGQGFEPASQVLWNAEPVSTRFVSGGELRAEVPEALLSVDRSVRVGVVNPTSEARISRFYSNPRSETTVRAGPNPWSAGRHGDRVRFFGLAPSGAVEIYSAAGRLVRRVAVSDGVAEWDLTDEGGGGVSSGLYFFLADGKDSARQRGTLTVIR